MIIPALLTSKKEELVQMLSLCAEFTGYAQIDIMDGEFVASESVTSRDLLGWRSPIRFEAHLMVSDPSIWLEPFRISGAERIIYHFEIAKDHREIISQIRESGLGVGLAVNPSTKVSQFEHLAGEVDTILFMSVNPGFYGAPFLPEVLEKVKHFRKRYPGKQVGLDGGIKQDNIHKAKEAGADYVCIGSAILKSNNPAESFREFVRLFDG